MDRSEGGVAEESAGGTGSHERGRDLTLLALAIVVVIEGAFAAISVFSGPEGRLVLSLGRFALISGMSYMTWQGFAFPRWILVVLLAFAVIGGPVAVYAALTAGRVFQAAALALSMAGYAVAAVLLALSPAVRDFLAAQRQQLDR
jgi:hypothetical protein